MKPSNDPIINMAAQEFKMKRESQEIQQNVDKMNEERQERIELKN